MNPLFGVNFILNSVDDPSTITRNHGFYLLDCLERLRVRIIDKVAKIRSGNDTNVLLDAEIKREDKIEHSLSVSSDRFEVRYSSFTLRPEPSAWEWVDSQPLYGSLVE